MSNNSHPSKGTFRELLTDKHKRRPGRPYRAVPRQSVYVELSTDQKQQIGTIGRQLIHFTRADVPDMAVMILNMRMEAIRLAVVGRSREMPEGITDMQSLYFLWDVAPVESMMMTKWTSIRLSPQQVDEFGALQGRFNLLFGANRSQVFTLALALLTQLVAKDEKTVVTILTIDQFLQYLAMNYL